MMGLMPIWAIIVPFVLGFFLVLLCTTAVPMIPAMAVLAVLVAIPVASVLLAAYCEDDRLVISKEGIGFPLMMLRTLGRRRERIWADLSDARLISGEKQNHLLLTFKSGGKANMDLANISRSDQEQFML